MKTATVRDVYDWLNQIAPFDTTESYDNAGLLLGSMGQKAHREAHAAMREGASPTRTSNSMA